MGRPVVETVPATAIAVTACRPVSVRPGSHDTTHMSPPTQRAICGVTSLVMIDDETTSIAIGLLPRAGDNARAFRAGDSAALQWPPSEMLGVAALRVRPVG